MIRLRFLLAGAALCGGRLFALTPQQTSWLSQGRRHDKAGWIYLHVEGPARERGFQHGYLLAKEIAEGERVTRADWEHSSGMTWDWLIRSTRGFIVPAIDAEDRDELQGIVEGMKAAGVNADYDDLVTYNASLELTSYWWPVAERKFSDGDHVEKPKQSCSSFIATGHMTRDGGIVLGHNTMFGYNLAICNVIADIAPTRGHHILMQTQAGWIHSGTDFFITDAGLVGSETTIGGFQHFSEKGIPEFIRMRRATQDANDIDGWCAVMRKGNNGGYANAWLIGDVKTGEIARLELGLKFIGFERTKDGYFVGSNIAENLQILRLETNINDEDIRLSSVARRVRWKQLMRENAGKIDVEQGERMEADCYDSCRGGVRPGSHSLDGHFELDGDVPSGKTPFEPSGTFDAKVVDSTLAKQMRFAARWGSADGTAFDADAFLSQHPQFDWMTGMLKSRPAEPWVEFRAGE